LTPEGVAFLAEATAAVQQADRAVEVARALAEGATGQLRMSYARTLFSGLPELIVSEYQRRFPGVEMTAESGTTGANVERLRSGELDLAFVMTPIEHAADLGCVDITTEPIVVALPRGHPLSRRRRIRREDVAGLPLVYFPRHQSPAYYDRCLSQVYGSATTPNIVRTEPSEERTLVAVGLQLQDRRSTLLVALRRPHQQPELVQTPFEDLQQTGVCPSRGYPKRRPPRPGYWRSRATRGSWFHETGSLLNGSQSGSAAARDRPLRETSRRTPPWPQRSALGRSAESTEIDSVVVEMPSVIVHPVAHWPHGYARIQP